MDSETHSKVPVLMPPGRKTESRFFAEAITTPLGCRQNYIPVQIADPHL